MKIDLATEKSVLVELSGEDLNAFDLTFDALDYENEQTRRAVESIMRCVREETGRCFAPERLQIDVLPNRTGGCLMIFTDCSARSGSLSAALFQTDSIDDLIDAARQLQRRGRSFEPSMLLQKGETFSLLLLSASAQTIRFLSEFAAYTPLNKIRLAVFREHNQTLIAQNALEILSGKRAKL